MWKTSVGLKLVVAVTGVILLLFVIGHMLGNLQVYLGQNALNAYAEKLRAVPPLLWVVRLGMATTALVHVIVTMSLWLANRRARPISYVRHTPVDSTISSRTMVLGGSLIFAFVVYHLMHFTWKVTNPEQAHLLDKLGRPDVYSMVVLGFQNVFVSAVYIIAMLILGFHITHGAASVFQTLGWSTPRTRPFIEKCALALAVVIVVGNISIPVSILLGLVRLPGGGM